MLLLSDNVEGGLGVKHQFTILQTEERGKTVVMLVCLCTGGCLWAWMTKW